MRVSLSALTWVALTGFAVLLLGCLVALIVLIANQRDITRAQRDIARHQDQAVSPLGREARPPVREMLEGLPRARAIANRSDRLVRTATPLLREIEPVALSGTTRNLGVLLVPLLEGDVPHTLRAVRRTATAVEHLPTTLRTTDRTLPQMVALLTQSVQVQTQSLDVQRQTLAATQATLATAQETLAVARETEGHAESLDRKLGGPLPASPVTTTTPLPLPAVTP